MEKLRLILVILKFFLPGIIFILFLNGSGIANLIFKNQEKPETQINLTISTSDTFRCATMDFHEKRLKKYPDYEKRLRDFEILTKNFIKNKSPNDSNVIVVPIVVHIIYNTPEQNFSNVTVQSQIDVLNKDFRRLNADTINTPAPFKPLGGDSHIEFVLAKRDPLGNPSIGITRTQTSVIGFSDSSINYTALGGHDIWDRDKYLNIWVCNLFLYGGYAQLPGFDPATDGVVIHYKRFGIETYPRIPRTLGRVATHEIGHWFNLQHIWGMTNCGDDYVEDTPTQFGPNYTCGISFPHITCNNGPYGDMFMNHMDYSGEECRNIFTIGQTNRMNAALRIMRFTLVYSEGKVPVSGIPIAHFRSDKMAVDFGQNVNFFDESGGIPTSWQWTFAGGVPSSSNIQNPTITYPIAGLYSVKLRISNSYGNDSVNYVNYIKVLGANMPIFSVLYPPSFTTIRTNSTDTTKSIFVWNKRSSHPTIKYKWKIRKGGTQNEFSYNSNNYGSDSLITIRNSFLDSLAMRFEPNSDSAFCIWKVMSYNGADSLFSQNELVFIIIRNTVGIKTTSSYIPDKFNVFQNYPNPFNPKTKIDFELPENGIVSLKIYDIIGREIAILANEFKKAGCYSIDFDGTNLSSGIYIYRISLNGNSIVKKMVVVK